LNKGVNMKTKSKLIIGMSALLAIVAASATASTLAWFTTTRRATVSFKGAGIYTTGGKLSAKYIKLTNGGTKEDSSGSYLDSISITGTTDNQTDISGLPNSFYSVTWNPTSSAVDNSSLYNSRYFATAFTSVAETDKAYVHFQINLKNEGTTSVNLVLQNGTDVLTKSQTTADIDAAKATRVAVLSGTTIKSVFAHSSDTSFGYVSPKDGSYLYGLSGYEDKSLALTGSYFHNITTDDPFVSVEKSTDITTYNSLGTLAGGGDSTFDVYIWSEGTDSSCTNDAKTGISQVSLKFSTINI
jgi:hypothetical protein